MTEPAASRGGRVARAACGSGLGVLVALAAHLAGGGVAPPLLLLVAATAVAQPVAVLLAGRSPRLWRQAAVTGLGQAAMHAVFALGAASAGTGPRAGAMAGMHGVPAPMPASMPMAAGHDMSAMAWWHVAAWLLTTAAWRWGEAALLGLLAGARRIVRSAASSLPPIGARTARALPPRPTAPAGAPLLLAADPRRGPPAHR